MRPTKSRALVALIVAGITAGAAYTPAATTSKTAKSASLTESRVSPDRHRSLRRTQLSVRVGCSSSGDCSATAQGGTGIYDSWEWYGADEHFDAGGSWSSADASGYCVSGAAVQVAARVTDSSGATALGERFIFCPN